MASNAKREDFNDVRDFLAKLSELSRGMSEAMVLPKKFKKGSDDKFEAVVAQAITISDAFSVMQTLLKDLKMINGGEE